LPSFSVPQVKSFRSVLSFLNEKDRDILYLIFVTGKKQKDVQDILQRSQPSLCYDIKRIRKRLYFVFYLHKVFDIFIEFLESAREEGTFEPLELEVLTLMFYTTSFTLTSEILSKPDDKVSQVKVRYTYDKCLRRLEDLEMWDVYEIFVVVRSNLNIIRRTYGSASDEVGNVCVRHVFIPY
jgi:hypothetical protein